MSSIEMANSDARDVPRFRILYRDAQAKLFRRNVLVAASVFMAFVSWDILVAPASVGSILEIRVLFLGVCTSLFVASGLQGFNRWYNWAYMFLLTSAGVGVAAILWLIPNGFAIGIAGIVICITASSVIFRATGWATASVGAATILATVVLMALHGEPEFLIRSHTIFMVAATGFAVLHSFQAERSAYETFQAQERLRNEKVLTQALLRDLTSMRQERLSWLENLARFLRHELKNQIVAVGTSIDLAQSGDSLEANQIYLERARRSLNRMRGLVSSATEATSLEAALAVDSVTRVELSPLVSDRVLTFQQLHPSRQLVLRPKPGLFIKGNEERLSQLLDKLLNNAAEHSALGAEIRASLGRPDEHWVELSIENEGDPLPKDRERIFEAFVSTRARPENLGLGLFVARSIAQNHGGTLVAEDLPRGAGARFVLRLPGIDQASAARPDLGFFQTHNAVLVPPRELETSADE